MAIKKTKVIWSIIVGFAVSVFTRFAVFVFTTDFSYIKIGRFLFLPKAYLSANFTRADIMQKYVGKRVLGAGGFPFSTFSYCSIERSGSSVLPVCNKLSTIGEFSILLNTIIWGTIIFYLLLLCSNLGGNDSKQ